MILLVILCVSSLVLNIVLGIGVYNLVRSTERYEDFFYNMDTQIRLTLKNMRAIDIRGSFEADDEVGAVFRGIRGMVESIDIFSQPDER